MSFGISFPLKNNTILSEVKTPTFGQIPELRIRKNIKYMVGITFASSANRTNIGVFR